MKTKTLKNVNIKVWWDNEEEFTIVSKNEPLYDTLIGANLVVKWKNRSKWFFVKFGDKHLLV